jgi:hypothetical protein
VRKEAVRDEDEGAQGALAERLVPAAGRGFPRACAHSGLGQNGRTDPEEGLPTGDAAPVGDGDGQIQRRLVTERDAREAGLCSLHLGEEAIQEREEARGRPVWVAPCATTDASSLPETALCLTATCCLGGCVFDF